MPIDTAEIMKGTRVSYEDRANPLREGTVVEVIVSKWGTEYRVAFDDGTETISDCRQHGWTELPGFGVDESKIEADLEAARESADELARQHADDFTDRPNAFDRMRADREARDRAELERRAAEHGVELMRGADGTIIGEKTMSDRDFLAPLLDAPTDDDLVSGDFLAEHAAELTPTQRERAAELVADNNPRHAIEGWAAGAEAHRGTEAEAGIYERALELVDERLRSYVSGGEPTILEQLVELEEGSDGELRLEALARQEGMSSDIVGLASILDRARALELQARTYGLSYDDPQELRRAVVRFAHALEGRRS